MASTSAVNRMWTSTTTVNFPSFLTGSGGGSASATAFPLDRKGSSSVDAAQRREQQDQMEVVLVENQQLKKSLTCVQSEYEELQDECKYYKAKVTELSDIVTHKTRQISMMPTVTSSQQQQQQQSQQQQRQAGITSTQSDGAEQLKSLHESLMMKSTQNAELTVKVAKLQSQLKDRDVQIESLSRERLANKRLLLEMSDIVRTLQSVSISYDTSSSSPPPSSSSSPETSTTADGVYLSAQQMAIKNIKKKVEAIMADRSLLVRRCKELENETSRQKEQIVALETQFHIVNSVNIAKGGVLMVAGAPPPSATASSSPNGTANITASSYSISTVESVTPMSPLSHCNHPNEVDDNATSVGDESMDDSAMTQSRLLREQQKVHEEQKEALKLAHGKQLQEFQKETEFAYKKMDDMHDELSKAKEDAEDAIIKRDEYKESLRDIIIQYKELHVEHEATTSRLTILQEKVDGLEEELRTIRASESEVERSVHHAVSQGLAANMDDIIAAYTRSVEKIAMLEGLLQKAEREADKACVMRDSGDRIFRDAVARAKKLEHERNQFQVLLDKAREDTRKAKIEAQKDREEAKHVRRRLTAYMQKAEQQGGSRPVSPRRTTALDRSVSPRRTTPVAVEHHPLSIPDLNRARAAARSIERPRGLTSEEPSWAKQRVELVRENQELKSFCEELLNEVAVMDGISHQ